MQVINVKAGVVRALTAYKVESGLSKEGASKWVVDHLKEALGRFKATCAKHKRDPETGVDAAFVDLKQWAQGTVHKAAATPHAKQAHDKPAHTHTATSKPKSK